jgi:hypothetical protein
MLRHALEREGIDISLVGEIISAAVPEHLDFGLYDRKDDSAWRSDEQEQRH